MVQSASDKIIYNGSVNHLQRKVRSFYSLSPALIYLCLTILLTWPTISRLTTHLPGDGADDPAIAWNIWWIKHALLNEGQNPFQTDYMFYPIGLNLAFYTLTVLNGLTALPLLLNFGVVTASNLHMFFTFVAGGYGAFLLTRYVLTRVEQEQELSKHNLSAAAAKTIWLSAAIAGGFYAFASSKLFYIALGQFNIGSSHWIPFTVLYILRSHHQPRSLKNPLMVGLFLTLQAWTEMTYASFLLIFIALYWLYWFIVFIGGKISPPVPPKGGEIPKIPPSGGPGDEANGDSTPSQPPPARGRSQKLTPRSSAPLLHLRAACIIGLTFLVGLSPILAQMLPDMLAEGDFLVEGSGFAQPFSADLLGFIIPTMHHPWLGHLITWTNIHDFTLGQHIYIGFVLLGLIVSHLRLIVRSAALRFWGVAALIFALLCLGPMMTIDGHSTGLSGPFSLLQQLPFFKGNRYPSRYSVMLMLSLSVLAGFGLYQHLRQKNLRQRSVLASAIVCLFLFEHLSLPLPQSDMRVPSPYQIIAKDTDDAVVLDVPLAWRNGFSLIGAQTTQFMFGQFYQTAHQKRLLQGNTSRNPEFKFQYFSRAPVISSLLALETGKPLPAHQWAIDRTIAADVLDFFNIKYIVVRPYSYMWTNSTEETNITATEQPVIPYIESVLPVEKIHNDPAINIYRVKAGCEGCDVRVAVETEASLHLDTTSPLWPLIFGEGWGLPSKNRPITAQRRQVRLLLPLPETAHQLTLRLRLPETSPAITQTVRLELNGVSGSPQPVGRAWTDYTVALPAGAAQPGLNDVRLHFSNLIHLPAPADAPPLDVTVYSTGKDVGEQGHIFVNGYDISPNQRGYNLALLQPGQWPQVAAFDTNADPAASTGLAEFLRAAPPEALLAVAVADEASANLGQEATLAMRSVGLNYDVQDCFRCSHAAISRGGHIIVETLDPLRPAGVTTALGLTEPTMAAQLEWIEIIFETE